MALSSVKHTQDSSMPRQNTAAGLRAAGVVSSTAEVWCLTPSCFATATSYPHQQGLLQCKRHEVLRGFHEEELNTLSVDRQI